MTEKHKCEESGLNCFVIAGMEADLRCWAEVSRELGMAIVVGGSVVGIGDANIRLQVTPVESVDNLAIKTGKVVLFIDTKPPSASTRASRELVHRLAKMLSDSVEVYQYYLPGNWERADGAW